MIKLKDILKEVLNEADPKVGTGKKPKGSGRRLYTDENPSDTVKVKFKTAQDIRDTLSKDSFKSKSHKRQSQIINLIHQRVRAAYQNAKDPDVKKRLKVAFDYAIKRKEASKEKTERMRKIKEEVEEKAGSVSNTLQRLADDDQKLRNEFAALIKKCGWSQELVDKFVAEKGTSKNDVFGDENSGRQKKFRKLFNSLSDTHYAGFSDKDWDNFFLLAQHFDSDRELQKQAQNVLLRYKGEKDINYRYITDRISCAETGTQKYRTQNGCNNEDTIDEKCWRGYTQKGTKILFGKKYPNCVKKEKK